MSYLRSALFTTCFAALSLVVSAQHSTTFTERIEPGATLSDYEQVLFEYGSEQTLQMQPGWKFLARYIHAQSIRASSDVPPDLSMLFEETKRVQTMKHTAPTRLRSASWSPAGPFSAPTPGRPTLIPGTGRINTITFHPTEPDIMWIGGGQGGLWKTTNGGASWFPLGDELPVMRVSDIAVNPHNPDEIYICIGDYAYLGFWIRTNDRKRNTHFGMGVYKSTDGGDTWHPTGLTLSQLDQDASLTRRVFINPENTSELLAAGIHGIWHSTDAGDTWSMITDEIIWDIEKDPSDHNTLYASTAYINNLGIGSAGIMKSHDFGATWTSLNTGIPPVGEAQRIEISVSPVNPQTVYAVACNLGGGLYGFYRSTNGGQSWTLRSNAPNILHWNDGLSSASGQGTYDLAILADPYDEDKVYVSGVNNWVSDNGGISWHGVSYWVGIYGPSVHADHHFLAHNPLDNYYYLCHDGGVSRTDTIKPGSWLTAQSEPDYQWPTNWEHLNDGLANLSFYRLGISQSSDNIYAGAQDMGTFLRDDGNWSYQTLGDGMECIIHPDTDDYLIGSSQFGNLFWSNDRGQTHNSLAGNPWRNSEFAAWTTPFQLDPNDPATIYVPAANLWTSNDYGATISRNSSLDNPFPISAFDASPADSRHMYMGKRVWYSQNQPGQLLYSSDSGTNWTDISAGTPVDTQYISFLETDEDDPNYVVAAFGGFVDGSKVFESRDAGSTWENISYNLPNVPANCIIQHHGAPNNPLYVGMDRGIYYKNDTMDHWEIYSEGLPNVIVSDFEIHKNDQKLYATTFGRGVWINDLIDQPSTSTRAWALSTGLSVAPNPNHGIFTIGAESLDAGTYHLEVVDIMGRKVYGLDVEHVGGGVQVNVSEDVLSGVYYVRLHRGKVMRVCKFLIVD